MHLNVLICQVDILGCSQPLQRGTGVRQGDIGECACTMPHAINDRTVIMSVCSLMAYDVRGGEHRLYRGEGECVCVKET